MNANAQRDANELRRQMDELQTEVIDRGWLLTLDDAVFTTNDADLSSSDQPPHPHHRRRWPKGFAEAIEAASPQTTVQTCIMHSIRSSLAHARREQ